MLRLPPVSEALQQSVWQSRGWTYQGKNRYNYRLETYFDHVFSSQNGNFQNVNSYLQEVSPYYICSRSSFQEDRIEGPFKMNTTETQSYDWFVNENTYCRHVEAYSIRNLTNGADILNAFQGVMHAMEPSLRTEFCWGLPLSAFDGALLWTGAGDLTRRMDKSAPTLDAESVLFPSWSWAGWVGPVRFRPDHHSDNRSMRTEYDSAVNRLGHITTLITWPWQMGFNLPPNGPYMKAVISDILLRGILRFVTSVARVNVRRLWRLFALQRISGWTLDDGTVVTGGFRTCIVLSEVENPQIGSQQPHMGEITGRSPITTYNVMVVKEKKGGVFERRGVVKITRSIWEACEPEIRWVTLL